ncbi:hypothetical protein K456DRAFT_261654 [Colletotrichum gloeosporioides 23]|nr:hypothetical protein K456DRAFT_261654 [Colletotrichum gloeosporioides 23]
MGKRGLFPCLSGLFVCVLVVAAMERNVIELLHPWRWGRDGLKVRLILTIHSVLGISWPRPSGMGALPGNVVGRTRVREKEQKKKVARCGYFWSWRCGCFRGRDWRSAQSTPQLSVC